ncbi:exosome complex component RRP4 homolog [Lathyrus oleraceus]|uniref:Exosome non-catalytic core subunit rrp4, variant 2 n=3 Tax=Pisum sativum TaxID=3888 RepID=A0A9D5AT36_PEA|nr:exosome complex component RRP4 homolog [Pisum sativum]XP_050874463.1 exosome complex component RRP4 homolog [Pisum sativum]XP_050874464.1 exosome complex component RRP4 homolog [Pisum sativum]KAI5423352.1 exosome non-catalytic core subunit rrp4, variant 2 [Pisum sativum]
MGVVQLQFSKTQKVRLHKAKESLSSKMNSDSLVTVADSIHVNHEDGVLKGHGTADLDGQVVATLCGTVERVNKLIYVRGLGSRYKPEVGDIVIGRVIEVDQKFWRLDINCNRNAYLMLSAMNMPDGVQRRRTALDELNMRGIFEEADLICAEVRGLSHDDIHLHARSKKYGKLSTGQMVMVSPYLVKRQKQHFHHLEEHGIDLIIGCNGLIWVGEHVKVKDEMEYQVNLTEPAHKKEEKNDTRREYICRAANAIRLLSTLGFSITLEVIKGVVDLSQSLNLEIHDMLGSEFCVLVAEKEAERRSSNKRKQ